MLTIEDIRNPARKSGFDRVNSATGGNGPNGEYAADRQPRWRASSGGGHPERASYWRGPSRANPEQAAQDYCDYINSGKAPTPKLRREPKLRKLPLALKRTPKQARPKPAQPVQDMSDREKRARAIVREEMRKRPSAKFHDPVVYLVGIEGDSCAVKVGYADYNVYSRVDSLQTGNPRPLILLGTIPGGKPKERELHEEFEPDNVLNEWFEPTRELLSAFDLTEKDYYESIGMEYIVV